MKIQLQPPPAPVILPPWLLPLAVLLLLIALASVYDSIDPHLIDPKAMCLSMLNSPDHKLQALWVLMGKFCLCEGIVIYCMSFSRRVASCGLSQYLLLPACT